MQLFRFHISQVSIAQKLERPIILCNQGYLPLDNDWYVLVKRQDWD